MFGVPGDYVLEFDALVEKGPIEFVGMTREDCAGLAADDISPALQRLGASLARRVKGTTKCG
jgi:TPP-dependent 2-oxoacid decarboxylase